MSLSTKPASLKKVTRSKIFRSSLLVVAGLLAIVLLAIWLRQLPAIQAFLSEYPGHSVLPAGAPVSLPAWLGWQHFLNMFFLILIIRSGWLVRTTKRPVAHWTRNNTGMIRTKRSPQKISLDLWVHLSLDALWVVNGAVFYVMLLVTGQWMRVVPTNPDVFPNALSAALQYASLNWPVENGWANYNALQLLAYFTVIFIAAPLALITGIRMSGAWPKNATKLNKAYPIEFARATHFPVMVFFVFFVLTHVALVLGTGALRNLNHMYAARDNVNWTGFWLFAASLLVTVIAWAAMRPLFLRPLASLTGKVTR